MAGLIDDKRGIFNRLSVFTSLKEIELKGVNGFNSITSINNDKDPIPFLLDLSTSLVGGDGLQEKLGLIFTQYIDSYNVKVKELLSNNLVNFKSGNTLPSLFLSQGITIPISVIDDFNNLKTEKSDPIGDLIYDDSIVNLLTKLKDAIIVPNSVITFNNINLIYNEIDETINIKPTISTTIGDFISSFISDISNINKKEFVTDILNKIYGLKYSLQNKTINEINKESELDIIINKLINEEESIEITQEETEEINRISETLVKGFNQVDLGCGVIDNILTIENLTKSANNINDSVDPFYVGNEFNKIFIDSLSEENDLSNTNKLKDSFIKKLINEIKNRLIKDVLFSPEKKMLFILFNYLQNDIVNLNDITNNVNYINTNKNIINCLIKDLKSDITEFIFNLVKTEILEITKPALNKIIIEKINNYRLILNSLISI